MIQSSFLVDAIATKHELGATAQDIEDRMKSIAADANVDVSKVKEYYEKEDQITRLSFQLTEQKVVDFLLSTANVEEKPASEIEDLKEEEEA